MNNLSIDDIIGFLTANPNVLLHPGKSLKNHVQRFNDVGKCPCDKSGTRMTCPCSELSSDLNKHHVCKCCLFVDENYEFLNVARMKEGVDAHIQYVDNKQHMLELYRKIIFIIYK